MRRRIAVLLVACAPTICSQTFRFTEHRMRALGGERVIPGERINGYAVTGRKLATWGDRLRWWSIPDGKTSAFGASGPFGEGGALVDVDGDGQVDVVVNETAPHALVWLQAPQWTRHVIDTGIDTADVMPAELFGRHGILVVHRRAQLRFYEIPKDPTARWPEREIYTFYTPSDQGGLALADVDGDGRPDILCGNYWIRAPEDFDLPWRLFAIELWNEQPHSAMLRLALVSPRDLIAMQREMPEARLALLEKPADPKQLWTEHRLADGLARPHSMGISDFDGDGRPDLLVGEQAGAGRVLIFHNEGAGRFTPHTIAAGVNAVHAHALDWNGDGRPDILTIGEKAISWWKNECR